MAFKKWMETQDYKGKQLDKDILVFGNKEYSPDKCIFVSPYINSLLRISNPKKKGYHVGHFKNYGKYYVNIKMHGKLVHIGKYSSPIEAEREYVKEKSAHITKVSLCQRDKKLMRAMIMYANFMRVNLECRSRLLGVSA